MLLNLLRRNPEEKLARLQIPLGRVVALGPGAVASLRASLIPAKLGAGLVVPESAELISGSAVTDVHLCGDVECLEKSGGPWGLCWGYQMSRSSSSNRHPRDPWPYRQCQAQIQ